MFMRRSGSEMPQRISNKSSAMSLAEVLITIATIGIIASVVLPIFINKVDQQKNIAALRKVYSVLQQVTNYVIVDNSEPQYWPLQENTQTSSSMVFSYYKPYLKVIRECANQTGCWRYPTKYLSGKVYIDRAEFYHYMFTLTDGINVLMNVYPKGIIDTEFGVKVDTDAPVFIVDVNGNNLPNQIGRDIFAFVLKGGSVVPAGIDNSYSCNRAASGLTCTARIINDGWKITYY